jgi:hypothetical protein
VAIPVMETEAVGDFGKCAFNNNPNIHKTIHFVKLSLTDPRKRN